MNKPYVYKYKLSDGYVIYCRTKRFVRGMQAKFLKELTFKQFLEAEKL
jgi:hypothetical protein